MDIKKLVESMNVKQRVAAALTSAALAGGGYYYLHGASVTPEQAVSHNMHQNANVKFTVLSGKDFLDPKTKQPKSTVLNNTADYKQSTMTIYIDRARCPGFSFASLQGKTITVNGVVNEWKNTKTGKSTPEIKVTSADQIKIN
jgi:hypothetical protein